MPIEFPLPQGAPTGGILPKFTYIPETGPEGILPSKSLRDTPAIPPETNSGEDWGMAKAVPVGEGYISQLDRSVDAVDVVNGMDQAMGKTKRFTLQGRAAQSSKNLGMLSAHEACGEFSGKFPQKYQHMIDTTA